MLDMIVMLFCSICQQCYIEVPLNNRRVQYCVATYHQPDGQSRQSHQIPCVRSTAYSFAFFLDRLKIE